MIDITRPGEGPSRRAVLGAGLASALGLGASLAGCTSSGSDGSSNPSGSATATATSTATSTGPTSPPSVASSTPASRTVSTVRGDVIVPSEPSRIVVLDTAELDSVLTLGLTPVGACRAKPDAGLPDYWPSSRLSPIKVVGTIGDPDLDAIAALEPDLILSNELRDAARYDKLTSLAPTVFTESTGYPWKSNFRLHAQALSLDDTADTVIDAYALHVQQVKDALGDNAGGHKVGVVRFVTDEKIRLYGRESFVGSVLDDAGVGRPGVQGQSDFATDIEPDGISRTGDATTLLYASYGSPKDSQQSAVTASAAWRALPAVQKHQDFPIEDQLWFLGIGYNGANWVLSRLQQALGA